MKFKTLLYSVLFSGAVLYPAISHAQQEPEDIALATDEFENDFYEALKQKGIENYDKALLSLQKCLAKQPNNPVIYNELGKNYLALKNYPEAEKAFLKAKELDPKNRWYWSGLYDVYYETQDYNKSIPVVQKLTEWRKEFYQEDLVSLYMYTQQFDKALALIDEMEENVGRSEKREMYKLQILQQEKYKSPQKDKLEKAIKDFPKEESNYIALIFLYSESNQEEKALEVARKLEKEIPTSDWAQVSLFKFHLNANDAPKAVDAMNRILGSKKIDMKIKHRVLNEFLIFSSTTSKYDKELEKAVGYFDDERNINVAKEVGKYFFNKKNFTKAAYYFSKGLVSSPDDIEGIELLLYSFAETGQYDDMAKNAVAYIDVYPTHSRLYYFAGLASNQLKQYSKAKEYLENALDFVVEDADLESDINRQLGNAWKGLGDEKKKDSYYAKAEKLSKSKTNK